MSIFSLLSGFSFFLQVCCLINSHCLHLEVCGLGNYSLFDFGFFPGGLWFVYFPIVWVLFTFMGFVICLFSHCLILVYFVEVYGFSIFSLSGFRLFSGDLCFDFFLIVLVWSFFLRFMVCLFSHCLDLVYVLENCDLSIFSLYVFDLFSGEL